MIKLEENNEPLPERMSGGMAELLEVMGRMKVGQHFVYEARLANRLYEAQTRAGIQVTAKLIKPADSFGIKTWRVWRKK